MKKPGRILIMPTERRRYGGHLVIWDAGMPSRTTAMVPYAEYRFVGMLDQETAI